MNLAASMILEEWSQGYWKAVDNGVCMIEYLETQVTYKYIYRGVSLSFQGPSSISISMASYKGPWGLNIDSGR